MADVVVDNETSNPKELLSQGIRALILDDFGIAVSALSKASELLVAEHGDDLHDSLGDVYLYYGRALLGLSREENEALGDAVPKNNDEEESDDDEDEVENVEAGGDEKADSGANANGEATTAKDSADGEEKSAGDDKPKAEEKSSDEDKVVEGATSDSGPSGSEAPAAPEDEPTDLQVAWEVLELAKKIYQKNGKQSLKNLAETMVVLGEISLESENFTAAIADIQEGLEIQKQLFGDDSRTVAETHYKLGIAYSTDSQIDEAVKSFESSLQILRCRIEKLETAEEQDSEVEAEVEEIKNLIPDVEEKIADMKSYKDETVKKIMSAISQPKVSSGDASSSSTSTGDASKPASDISHLVKRKRKVDDILEESEKEAAASAAKKPPL